jgi:hypothetical protein
MAFVQREALSGLGILFRCAVSPGACGVSYVNSSSSTTRLSVSKLQQPRAVLQAVCAHHLLLSCREPPQQAFHKGCIWEYDPDHDCFIVWCEDSGQYAAVQFNQFVVEASGGQLVLKVPACTRQPLPAPYWSAGPGEGASQAAGTSK